MNDEKYKFVFEYAGGKVECHNTQAEIAEMLCDPGIRLISISGLQQQSGYYRRKKGKIK